MVFLAILSLIGRKKVYMEDFPESFKSKQFGNGDVEENQAPSDCSDHLRLYNQGLSPSSPIDG